MGGTVDGGMERSQSHCGLSWAWKFDVLEGWHQMEGREGLLDRRLNTSKAQSLAEWCVYVSVCVFPHPTQGSCWLGGKREGYEQQEMRAQTGEDAGTAGAADREASGGCYCLSGVTSV